MTKSRTSPLPSSKVDYARAARELVRAVRGKKSQNWLSRRLGYGFNKVCRWETGAAALHWEDFVKIAKVLRLDVARALRMFVGFSAAPHDDKLVGHLLAGVVETTALKKLKWSTRLAKAQRSGHRRVLLSEILHLIELNRLDVIGFVGCFAPPETLPAFVREAKLWAAEIALYLERPATHGVIRCLELEEYRQAGRAKAGPKTGLIAARLGIDVGDEIAILAELERLGLIKKVDGLFELTPRAQRPPFLGGQERGRWDLIGYWLRRAVQGAADRGASPPREGELWSFRTISCSKKAQAALRQYTVTYLNGIQAVLDRHEGEPCEQLLTLNFNMFEP
jgi:hypothetical protein